MAFKCEQGHNNHKSIQSASMCNAAARTASNSAAVAAARMRTQGGPGSARMSAREPIPKPGERKRRQAQGGDSALQRNAAAAAGEAPPADLPEVPEVAAPRPSGSKASSKSAAAEGESKGKLPHGLQEADVKAFAKVYERGTLAAPLFRPDLLKPERRILRGTLKSVKVINHGRLANEEGVEKSAFWFDPRTTDKAMVAKYVEAAEALLGRKLKVAAKGDEVARPVKEKGAKSAGRTAQDYPDVPLNRVTPEEQAEIDRVFGETPAADSVSEAEDAPPPAPKKGSKKGSKKSQAAS